MTSKPVKLITLKALLTPSALCTLEPGKAYRFCPDAGCDVVYFAGGRWYPQADVKVRGLCCLNWRHGRPRAGVV